jgi:hypothetical protein
MRHGEVLPQNMNPAIGIYKALCDKDNPFIPFTHLRILPDF